MSRVHQNEILTLEMKYLDIFLQSRKRIIKNKMSINMFFPPKHCFHFFKKVLKKTEKFVQNG